MIRPEKELCRVDLQTCELHAAVQRALVKTGLGPLQGVHVNVNEGHVHLRGSVPSYYVKQRAQHAVLCLPDARRVFNDLVVR